MSNPTDWRALCAIAVELWDADCDMESVISQMRAALAQPEPEGVTDEELVNFRNRATADCCASRSNNGANLLSSDDLVACQAASLRAVLTRYARPNIQPEPEAPTDEELTDMAEFYIEDNGLLGLHNAGEFARAALTRWGTPANALPTPEATNV